METFIHTSHSSLISFGYCRDRVRTGIVHIGVGNFHRAHEEFYINHLLQDPVQQDWGICGIALLPEDEPLYRALKSQDNLYTLTVCGRNGKDIAYEIGSLKEMIWGIENPEAVIAKIASPEIKILTFTITEGGYNLDKATGRFMLENETIRQDIEHPDTPRTVFGFVAAGLRRRKENGNGPLTLLSCDNLQHNGNTARKAFLSFIEAQDKTLAEWVGTHVSFPNCMVDRITPVVTAADKERLNRQNETEDAAPVYCEDFIQWVIEDNFIAGRPDLEKIGVEFTDDVSAYENMKLSLLNASHSMLSYPAFLSGYRKVDDAMHDSRFVRYLQEFMDTDITPYVPAPGNTDLCLYKRTLIERFGNRSVSDQLSRLCADGASKIPVYIMPNLIKMIRDKADPVRMAFFTATYRHYLKYRKDNRGETFEINDPWLTENDWEKIGSGSPLEFLSLSPFESTDLQKAESFVRIYLKMTEDLQKEKVVELLEKIIQ